MENGMNREDETRAEDKAGVEYEIPPKKFAMLPFQELLDGKSLEIRNDEGLPIAELQPVVLGATGKTADDGAAGTEYFISPTKTVIAFELIFGNGEKVLLDYPSDFSGVDFAAIREQEGQIVNGEFLQQRLFGIPPDFDLLLAHTGVKITNTGRGNEYCKFKERGKPEGSPKEGLNLKGRSGYYKKNATGGDGVFEGEINDGRKVYAVTAGVVGKCDKYGWNEDSVGIGMENGRIVVGDGIGGGSYGECASSYMVDAILASGQKSLSDALLESHYRFYIYNRNMLLKQASGCDTVLAGVQIRGDEFEAFNMGDTKWRLIRDGEIIANSKTQSFVGRLLEEGMITAVEALAHPARNIVHNTAGSIPYDPDIQSGKLKKGDILWIYDDGLALTEEEICRISGMKDFTPSKAARRALVKTRIRNKHGTYAARDDNGQSVEVPAPMDNLGLAIYRH